MRTISIAIVFAALLGEVSTAASPTAFVFTLVPDARANAAIQTELKYDTREWHGSTFWTGPDWTRVGKDWHHPGQNTASVRRFTCPRDGRITITGRVFKRHLAGDGIVARVFHNNREIWRAQIAGDDATGKSHALPINAHRGDTVRFVVEKNGSIGCDTTGWDPTIAYDDGTAFTASAAFAAHKQGASGWHYEMAPDGQLLKPTPSASIRYFGQDLSLTEKSLPARLTQQDALPFAIISTTPNDPGHVVAFDSSAPWALSAAPMPDGTVRLEVVSESSAPVWHAKFRGDWGNGLIAMEAAIRSGDAPATLRKWFDMTLARTETTLPLWAMVQEEWIRQDQIDGSVSRYLAATTNQTARAMAALASLGDAPGAPPRQTAIGELSRLSARCSGSLAGAAARSLWLDARILKRRILLAHPLLDFGELLVCKRAMPSWCHLVAQYYGWRQRPGGGLFVVTSPGHSLETRDILRSQLPPGSVLEPRLAPDGRRILFAHVACGTDVPEPAQLPVNERGDGDRYFHLYEINIDGSGLRQITDDPYDDMMAEYLPGGDIVFCSTRRKGYSRCFGPEYSNRWHTYTLHRMRPDGSHIRTLSFNDVSEWFPCIAPSGEVLFARWDYIDRDAVTHQNLWAMRPDGTNPTALWGNATPKPHCTFQARPVPGSRKLVFIASAHHSITGGPVCLLDPTIDPNSLDAVTRLTPEPFPEAEGKPKEWYQSPWPLSESLFLVAHSPFPLRFQGEHIREPNPDNALGICLLDSSGNRELLYRDPDISTTTPVPLRPSGQPPKAIATTCPSNETGVGRMLVADIYQGLGDVPRGTIKELRIVQLFPKSTWLANNPRMGVAGEENGRAIIGTVPVEADGSAYFEVPAGKQILFQALDSCGMAYQTMRSSTYVQPGETTACIGCHEHRMLAPPPACGRPLATTRPPSRIDPGKLGGRPFGFVEMVQPILDAKCVSCHGGEKTDGGIDLSRKPEAGFNRAYIALCGTPDSWKERGFVPAFAEKLFVPRFVQRNQIQMTPPGGAYGARGSRLMRLLLNGDGHEGVRLSDDDIRRLAAWIDLNAIFYGTYEPELQSVQLSGKPIPMPATQ